MIPTLQHLRGFMAGLAITCFLASAHAVDPNRNMSQYIREQWGIEEDSRAEQSTPSRKRLMVTSGSAPTKAWFVSTG